jgi:hypothetical protein
MGLPSQNATSELVSFLGEEEKNITSLRYRGHGWPGYATIRNKKGEIKQCTYIQSWGAILGRDTLFRCKVCPNGFGEFADITCGDGWFLKDGNEEPSFETSQTVKEDKEDNKVNETNVSNNNANKQAISSDNLNGQAISEKIELNDSDITLKNLESLANSKNELLRIACASELSFSNYPNNENEIRNLFNKLANDNYVNVREQIVLNKETPLDIKLTMLMDDNENIRTLAKDKITDLIKQDPLVVIDNLDKESSVTQKNILETVIDTIKDSNIQEKFFLNPTDMENALKDNDRMLDLIGRLKAIKQDMIDDKMEFEPNTMIKERSFSTENSFEK